MITDNVSIAACCASSAVTAYDNGFPANNIQTAPNTDAASAAFASSAS